MKVEDLREKILEACYQFLLPVARFLLRSGVSYREFEGVSKRAFVAVASDDYGIRGRPTNISRVAAMTGIPRKEVGRLRKEPDKPGRGPWKRLGPPGDVLHGWYTDSDFRTEIGTPAVLRFEGEGATFSTLTRRYAGDIPPGALRAELLRLGTIEESADGQLRVLQRHVVPSAFDEKLLTSLSFNLYALASTIAYNSNPNRIADGRIERFVHNGSIPIDAQKEVGRDLRMRIQGFAETVDDFLAAAEGPAASAGPVIGVGVYYFQDDNPG